MSAPKPNRTFGVVPEGPRALTEWTNFLSELFFEGEFETALLGCATEPSGTARYTVSAGIVCLTLPELIAVSNSVNAFLDGLPEEITPNHDQQCLARIVDNGVTAMGIVQVGIDTGITLFDDLLATVGGFTASGSKGLRASIITYPLD